MLENAMAEMGSIELQMMFEIPLVCRPKKQLDKWVLHMLQVGHYPTVQLQTGVRKLEPAPTGRWQQSCSWIVRALLCQSPSLTTVRRSLVGPPMSKTALATR
jgi:hypothetical protein